MRLATPSLAEGDLRLTLKGDERSRDTKRVHLRLKLPESLSLLVHLTHCGSVTDQHKITAHVEAVGIGEYPLEVFFEEAGTQFFIFCGGEMCELLQLRAAFLF